MKHNNRIALVTIAAIIGLVLVATLCSCMKTEPDDGNETFDEVVVFCAGRPMYAAKGLKAKEVTVQSTRGGFIRIFVPAVDSKGKIIGEQCFEGASLNIIKKWK